MTDERVWEIKRERGAGDSEEDGERRKEKERIQVKEWGRVGESGRQEKRVSEIGKERERE